MTVSGLSQGFTYKAAVRAQCSSDYMPGEWNDTLLFTTAICPSSSNLTYSDLQENSVVLDWQTEGENVYQWEFQYGQTGFTYGNSISVITDHHPYTLQHLNGETNYFYLNSQFPCRHLLRHPRHPARHRHIKIDN